MLFGHHLVPKLQNKLFRRSDDLAVAPWNRFFFPVDQLTLMETGSSFPATAIGAVMSKGLELQIDANCNLVAEH